MFSVTKTGTKSLPLCTWKVSPTNSGVIIDRRDQVRITCFEPALTARPTLLCRLASTKGPFLSERAIYLFPRRLTMYLSVRALLRVLWPLVGTPQGVHGCRPPDDLPSPPPIGWSIGFIATPRTLGRRPSQRERPAFPMLVFSWSGLPTCPTVAMQRACTRRCSPLGIRSVA